MTSTFLHAMAASGGHPLIDIDWTAFLQFAIYLATALIASQLLFRPYLAMRDRRAAGIEGARGEATRMSAEADAALVSYEQEIARARSRANEERRVIRAEAAAHLREVTDSARRDAGAALDEAKARVVRETAAARAQLLPRASELATEIASRLLGRRVS